MKLSKFIARVWRRLHAIVSHKLDTLEMAKRFGKPILSVDIGNGNLDYWILSYYWRGTLYVAKQGYSGPGGFVEVPAKTIVVYG